MLKFLIGFILGCAATFYSLPWIEDQFGVLPRPDINFGTNRSSAKQNAFQKLPLEEKIHLVRSKTEFLDSQSLATRELTAVAYEIKALSPHIDTVMDEVAADGLTVEEGVAVINFFLRHKSDKPLTKEEA